MSPSKKRGRPSTFPVEEVSRLISGHVNEILIDGHVAGKNEKIWKTLSAAINSAPGHSFNISPVHLYVTIKEDRYQLLTSLLYPDGRNNSPDQPVADVNIEKSSSSSQQDDKSTVSTEESSGSNKGTLNFNITLSRSEWNSIRPEQVTYVDHRRSSRREYMQLKRRTWTHVINSHFWRATKLACKLSYWGGRVKTDSLHSITVNGICSFCKSKFVGNLSDLPNEGEEVTFKCFYRGDFSSPHPKGLKRNLAGEALRTTLLKVKEGHMSATGLHELEADKLMSFGDVEPAHLPSANQIRHAKSKSSGQSRIDNNPIVSLGILMHETRCKNIIRDLSYDKFSVTYYSSTQIHVLKQFCKNSRIISLAIDATGGLVKKIHRAAGVKSGNIFLYSIVIRDSEYRKILPVCSLLSEKHDTESIRHWLATFMRCNVPLPHEVVVDMSIALMSACVQAFTALPSLYDYIDCCSELLFDNIISNKATIPRCFIRNDVAHVVKLMTTWNCFKNSLRATKHFFMRSLCQAVQSTKIDEVFSLLYHIITVSLSETEGSDQFGQPTPCELSKKVLCQRIGGLISNENSDLFMVFEDADIKTHRGGKNNSQKTTNPFVVRTKLIVEQVQEENVAGDRGNQQYLPTLVNHILDISSLIPLWTGVMCPIFKYGNATATSAPVETYFNILKNVLLKHVSLPVRVDDFVQQHIVSIEGAMKLAEAKTYQTDFENINPDAKSELHQRMEESREEEDWRGLSSDMKTMRKPSSYLVSHSEYAVCDTSKNRYPNIGLLKNGNLFQLKPIQIEGRNIILSNTCPFDSLSQLFCTAFADSENFQNFINSSSLPFFNMVRDVVLNGITRKTYNMRGQILVNMSKSQSLVEGITKVACEAGVSTVAAQLLASHPSVIEQNKCSSQKCTNQTKNYARVPLSIYMQSPKEVINLDKLIIEEMSPKDRQCPYSRTIMEGLSFKCVGVRKLTNSVSEYLLLEPIQIENNENRLLQCVLKLRSIPTHLQIEGKSYHLRGCVGFIGSDDVNQIGHYVAYCCRGDGLWETYNDLKDKKSPTATRENIKCHLILYTQ